MNFINKKKRHRVSIAYYLYALYYLFVASLYYVLFRFSYMCP